MDPADLQVVSSSVKKKRYEDKKYTHQSCSHRQEAQNQVDSFNKHKRNDTYICQISNTKKII